MTYIIHPSLNEGKGIRDERGEGEEEDEERTSENQQDEYFFRAGQGFVLCRTGC